LRGEKEKKYSTQASLVCLCFCCPRGKGQKRDEGPCILAGGEERVKVQHPGFARLPLLLLHEGERAKKRWGPCILAGGKEEEERKVKKKKNYSTRASHVLPDRTRRTLNIRNA